MQRNAAIRGLATMVIGLALLVWFTGSAAGAGQPTTERDATGDSAGAVNLVSTTVSDAYGIVTLTVRVAGHRFDQPTSGVFAFHTMVDIDRSAATGTPSGVDYDLFVCHDASGLSASAWQFDGGWRELELQPSLTFATGSDTYTFTFATSELGGGSGFDYYVTAFGWSALDPLVMDRAPDRGTWTYWPLTTRTWNGGGAVATLADGTLYLAGDDSAWHLIDRATLVALGLGNAPITLYTALPGAIGVPVPSLAVETPLPTPTPVTPPAAAPVVKPVIATPLTYPSAPVAGKTFRLTFAVTRSDTGGKMLAGRMICDPSVKGTVIKHFELFKNGTATMRFTIPKAYKGKLMKVHLTIEALGQSATRNIVFRVV